MKLVDEENRRMRWKERFEVDSPSSLHFSLVERVPLLVL